MKSTFTYKKIGNIEIKADLFQTETDTKQRPHIMWLHGGAMVSGSREDIPKEQINFYLDNGFSVLTIDYRLAPKTHLTQISEDIQDAILWAIKNDEKLNIDKKRIYLIGHSAGAYLSILSGTFAVKPRAIVSFYGYGNIMDDWAHKPDSHYLQMDKVDEETALSSINNSVVTNASFEDRFNFYVYTRQSGKWGELVTGLNKKSDQGKLEALCPVKNIKKDYPPTLLIHGNKDTDVPFLQSVKMSKELENKKINHKFISMEEYGHMFDKFEGGLENKEIKRAFEEVVNFLKEDK